MRITIKPFELRGFNLSPDIRDVSLRVYALNYFIRQSDGVIVQPGGPAESPFYEEWACTRNNGSLLLPEIALESTIDALAPAHPEQLRYYAGFFDPGGNMLCAFWPRPIFALDTNPNPTTWAHVIAYNSPGVEFDWTTTHAEHYSKEEFDALLQNPPQSFTGITVLPPLYFDGTTLWIPRASATQDGYLAAEDFIAFSIGAGMGVISFNTRQGVIVLLSQDVLDALTYTPINKAGDTMTGPLILHANPTSGGNPLQAATRAYVDALFGGGDVTPPTITAGPTVAISDTSATITWTTSEATDQQVQWGTSAPGSNLTPSTPSGMGTSHSVTLTPLIAGTTYHYHVKSSDAAHNPLSPADTDHTFTTTGGGGGGDSTAPVITAVNASSIDDTSATITWTTDDLSDSQVQYSVDPDTSYSTHTATTDTGAGVTSHLVTLSGVLAPGTTYHYRVKSTNAATLSQTGVATPDTFMTTAAVDLLTGLLAYWKLDEASGVRVDSTSGAHTLTPVTAFTTSSSKTGFNICPHFVGDGNLLYAADGTVASMGPSIDYTIAAWVQVEDKTVSRTWISKSGTGHDEYILNYETSLTPHQFSYTVQHTPNYYTIGAADLGDPVANTWYLIVVWHDVAAETINIQVNNGAVNSFTLVEPPNAGTDPLRLGSFDAAGTNKWFGLVDELAVWQGRVLDVGARSALWNGGAGKPFDTWS